MALQALHTFLLINLYQKFHENPELEIEILKQYIVKKKIAGLEEPELKKKLYQQSFSENSIFRVIKD